MRGDQFLRRPLPTIPSASLTSGPHNIIVVKMGKTFKINSISELSEALCEARIARGLTQKELGELLGVHEQQIQRYEANDYKQCSWRRVIEICDALDVKFRGRVSWPKGEVR